ncbi:hypothetical protein C4568_01400 [Candidatus Parcubacteria bacterium]|nr:MAG: hypothetical protein C4568_01400 [Candidatus Parcubacteria bacterium]
MKFREYFFEYSLVALILLVVVVGYARFMVARDYVVAYEAECDAATSSCFIGCEDDECLSTYYYALIEKPAADVYAQCGKYIADCESINHCLPTNDTNCVKFYCDPDIDGELCEIITAENFGVVETIPEAPSIEHTDATTTPREDILHL